MLPMRLGLGSFSATWAIGLPGHPPADPLSPVGFLAEARRLGLKLVQVCDNLPLIRLEPRDLDTFRATARDHGIAVELGTRGIAEPNLRAHLELARTLGSPLLRVVLDLGSDEPTPEEAHRRLAPLQAAFQAAGVRLAIENHDRFTCATLVELVERLGADWAGICLDTVNSLGALEGPETVIDQLAPHALSLHIKDFTISRPPHQMGFVVEGCPAGRGRLRLASILERIRANGRAVDAILETWVSPGPTLEETIRRERAWTEEGVLALRQLIPG